jgi:hypothetical protein
MISANILLRCVHIANCAATINTSLVLPELQLLSNPGPNASNSALRSTTHTICVCIGAIKVTPFCTDRCRLSSSELDYNSRTAHQPCTARSKKHIWVFCRNAALTQPWMPRSLPAPTAAAEQ